MTEESPLLRELIVACFERFIARPLGRDGRITKGDWCFEKDVLEKELIGKAWHSLISYHHRWDVSLTNLVDFTVEAFVDLLSIIHLRDVTMDR